MDKVTIYLIKHGCLSVDNPQEFRCISLCSGYGGIELGLGIVIPNLRTVAYVAVLTAKEFLDSELKKGWKDSPSAGRVLFGNQHIEAFAVANLVAKMEAGLLDVAPVWTDIADFDGRPFRNRIHIITAGYPCQPFSVAGKRKGTKDPRHLWPHIERILKTVRPFWFFGENVPGHLGLGFPEVYRSLRNLGYAVEAGLFSAAECGAPHRRQRLFILANNQSYGTQRSRRTFGKGTQRTIFNRSSKTMAYTNGRRKTRKPEEIQKRESGVGGNCKLAESSNLRLQGKGYAQTSGQAETWWPARPGKPQYEWEEPRVLVNADNSRQRRSRRTTQRFKQGFEMQTKKAQSKLGRAAYGASCRVDRLRLLGNGVVPQQAAKAFRYLIARMRK